MAMARKGGGVAIARIAIQWVAPTMPAAELQRGKNSERNGRLVV